MSIHIYDVPKRARKKAKKRERKIERENAQKAGIKIEDPHLARSLARQLN